MSEVFDPDLVRPYVDEARDTFGDELAGMYVFGSVVTGETDAGSDIDTAVITRERLFDGPDNGQAAADGILAMHDRLAVADDQLAERLESLYFGRDQLDFKLQSSRFMFVQGPQDEELSGGVHPLYVCTPIVTNAVREQGLALYGPPPEAMFPTASRESIRHFVGYMFRESDICRPPSEEDPDAKVGLQFVELLRLYYTHIEEAPVTKRGVMDWFHQTRPDLAQEFGDEAEAARAGEAFDRQKLEAGVLAVLGLRREIPKGT